MISKFLTELSVSPIGDDDKLWRTNEELQYQSHIFNGVITVPKGFVTDFSSVPKVPVVYETFGNRAHRESVIHDFLYQTHLVSKWKADRIFLEAMKARNKPIWVRYGMYWGVVLGGFSAYKSGKSRYRILGNAQ